MNDDHLSYAERLAASLADVSDSEIRALFRGLMKYVPDGITIADAPDVRIRYVSYAGARMLGRIPEDLSGQPAEAHPEQWGIFHLDGVTKATPDELPLTRATKHGEVVRNEPWLLRRPDGTDVYIRCNAGPIRTSHGKIRWGVIVWRDQTELWQLERQQAAERQRALELEMALVDEANHRIKNNLSLVSALLELQAREGEPSAAGELRAAAHRIQAVTALYSEIIETRKSDSIATKPLLEGVCRNLEVALSSAGTPLALTPNVADLEVAAESAWCMVLIVNELVTNASKHGRDADGACNVQVSFSHSNGTGWLEVVDRGTRIPAQDVPTNGNGFGLRIVKLLVSQLRGEMRWESDAAGSRFTICFPLEPDASRRRLRRT